MSDESFSPRLVMIETQWSLLRKAHQASLVTGNEARSTLVMRYSTAIRSYVRAMTGNDQDADEIAQDTVVRLLKGDFAGANPERGRFRDLLKVAVRNMVRNHWDKQNRRKGVDYDLEFVEGNEDTQLDDAWESSWRQNVLDIAWSQLRDYQEQTSGSVAFSVLKLRAEQPQLDSTQLAAELSTQIGREIKPAAVRQQLRRARVRFAELLVEEIANGLDQPDRGRIQEELISLGIYENIKDVIPKQWA